MAYTQADGVARWRVPAGEYLLMLGLRPKLRLRVAADGVAHDTRDEDDEPRKSANHRTGQLPLKRSNNQTTTPAARGGGGGGAPPPPETGRGAGGERGYIPV